MEDLKLLNKNLRIRYLLTLILSMIVPVIFVGVCLYYLMLSIWAEEMILPDIISRDLLPVIERINLQILIGLPLLFIIMIVWASILSYRMLKPLEHLEEDLKKISEGDYSVRIDINEDHDLKPVADIVNNLVTQLEEYKKMKNTAK
ncbi:integral membrane sensor signal transduction histidine kinase [Candidatus Omnitrophus magneticus]|uniref:Integral membrane sensor signal transduction histidine kinase n=1 Tax=Candidatus Omnitrophus magneticus TaxID=1609969 RepID=A0A0F0CRL5_9BACT|nr:integral membrane sensor signal transduction histidine kinase [Candidatus Omnitrophus magneticus]